MLQTQLGQKKIDNSKSSPLINVRYISIAYFLISLEHLAVSKMQIETQIRNIITSTERALLMNKLMERKSL
jgi:hypothetical protein